MSRQDKVLEIMSLAQLPLHAKVARLAHKWIGKPFPIDQATAVVKCYLEGEGRVPELARRLANEKHRQDRLRNERKALADARKVWERSPLDKYRRNPKLKEQRALELAQKTFGQHVRDNFNEDTIALMSLISGEVRSYQVRWLAGGFKPVRCALIQVSVYGKGDGGGKNYRYLLYQAGGRVLVARTESCDIMGAWALQVNPKLVSVAADLRAAGCRIETDLESQEMVVIGPDECEMKRVAWEGRTVDE